MRLEGSEYGKRNAKRLRKEMTPPEIGLWLALRQNDAKLHFRKQHAVGDYVLDFYKELWENEKIEVINNTDENHSGFAADAYARVNGIGCVVVTYSVGASKVINAVQCAYAERSPLIVISGAPGMNERNEDFLLHHMVGSFNSQKKLFENITCASVVLDNPSTAGYEIDKALEALKHYKRPIYIELPRDVAKKSISYDVYKQGTPVDRKSTRLNSSHTDISRMPSSA